MKTYAVSCLLSGRSFEFTVRANSAADAIAIARQTYGADLRVFGAHVLD